MPVAKQIASYLTRSSWIRAMFEAGAKLKAQYGAENVFDFSLGNPNLEPPAAFFETCRQLLDQPTPGAHGYMPNPGFMEARQKVAQHLSARHGLSFDASQVVMTVGAGGALNIIFKTILNPGDEVVVPTPYFVEYDFYAENHGGKIRRVPTTDQFQLDVEGIANALGENTAAVLINTPNNPTGQIYSAESLTQLGQAMSQASQRLGRAIYLISDEPYSQIVYDGAEVASVFAGYPHTILATSFSKSLSLAGERIGYLAVHPDAADRQELMAGLGLSTRILGYVNAPALLQRAVSQLLDLGPGVEHYARKRDLMLGVLDRAGIEYVRPVGAFYVFPTSPLADDVAFVKEAQKENLLLVPGSGFMGPGHFRIAFCTDDQTIINSEAAFGRLMKRLRG